MYIGTVVRSGSIINGGKLLSIDFENKRINKSISIFPQNPSTEKVDTNKRGNSRGCRGIFKYNEFLVACDFHSLLFLDSNLEVKYKISDHGMVGLHELYFDEKNEKVYLTSTTINTIIVVDLKMRKVVDRIYLNSDEKIVKDLSLSSKKKINFDTDFRISSIAKDLKNDSDHMHLNAITMYKGDILVLLNRKGIIYNITKREIVLQHDNLIGGHNISISEDLLFSCNTLGHSLFIYSLEKKVVVKEIDIKKFKIIKFLDIKGKIINIIDSCFFLKRYKVVKSLFCRGLQIDGDFVFMGTSPAIVLKINWKNGTLIDSFKISSNPRVCVHGLFL